jgi:hypothetical protein
MHTWRRRKNTMHSIMKEKTLAINKNLNRYKFQVHSCKFISIATTAVASNAEVYVSSEEFA